MKRIFDISKAEIHARNLICALMVIIAGFLLCESFMHTMVLTNTKEMFEEISYHHDNFIFSGIYVIAVFSLLTVFLPKLEKLPVKVYGIILTVLTLVMGIWWVLSSQASPTADQYQVSHAAWKAAHNDYSFMTDQYFSSCPYQLGMVLFYEVQIRLFGKLTDTVIYTQIINVFYLAAAYITLIIILGKLFRSRRVQIIAAITMMSAVQPLLYTTFVYAIIPGIANVLLALLFEIKYFETENRKKYIWAALSAFFMTFSIMVKTNNYIALIALMGIAAVKFINRRRISDAVYIAVTLVLSLNVLSGVSSLYEHRSGEKLTDPIPMICYVAMGLDDPHGSYGCNAKGWYSAHYTFSNFASRNYDPEATAEFAKDGIRNSVDKFASDYGYTNDFFYEKNTSQWNEPSYACLWVNLVMRRYNEVEPGKLCKAVLNTNGGKSHSDLLEYMNIHQLFIFLGTFAGVLVCFKKKDLFCSSLILIILGAFLYHMIFEGKSQYIMPYYIILTGFSAAGTDMLVTWFAKLKDRIFSRNTVTEKSSAAEAEAESKA